MDQEFKTYLAGMESRLLAHVDGVGEISRARIEGLEEHVQTHLEGVELRFRARMEGLEEYVRAQIEQSEERSRAHTEMVETRLLKEFWKWARTADARYRQHQANVSGLDLRVQSIEDRLSDLEQNSSQ